MWFKKMTLDPHVLVCYKGTKVHCCIVSAAAADTSRGPAYNAGIVHHRTDEMVIRQNKNTMSDGWCTRWCNW